MPVTHEDPVVLMIDDQEWAIRPWVVALSKKYRVRTARSVVEARTHYGRLDECSAVVVDLMLPSGPLDERTTSYGRTTGAVLVEEIHRRRPSLPIFVLTNNLEDPDHARLADTATVLVKGHTPPSVLMTRLEEVVRRPE